MPARARATSSRKSAPEPEPEVEDRASQNGEKDYTLYADKEITPTMEAFGDFLIDEVYEGELPRGFDEESFRKGVALGGSVRMDFQRSDYWAQDERNRKNREPEEAEEEPTPRRSGRASRRAQAEETPAPPRSRRGRSKAQPEPEPEDIDDED